MRILIISPFLYGPNATHGGGVLAWRQLSLLAQRHELSFLGFSGTETAETEQVYLAALRASCQEVRCVHFCCTRGKVLRARLSSLLVRSPGIAELMDQASMHTAIREMVPGFDRVWIQFPQMATYVQDLGSTPALMDVQDAYTLSAFRNYRESSGLRRWIGRLEWLSCAEFEARWYPRFRHVLTLSEQEASTLKALTPDIPAVAIGLPLAGPTQPEAAPEAMRIGFAGSFGHHPNVHGLLHFLKSIWPSIHSAEPRARCVIAGREPPQSLLEAASEGIEFAGFVPDIQAFYAANAVTVVPLYTGGGVKIKTVEALLSGSAVVSTPIGAEGTGAQSGRDLIEVCSDAAFASAVVALLQNEEGRARLAASGRRHAESFFSETAWLERIEVLLGGDDA